MVFLLTKNNFIMTKTYTNFLIVMFCLFTTISFAQINNQTSTNQIVTNQVISEECGTESYMTSQQRSVYLQTRNARNSWQKAETVLEFPIQLKT